MAYGFAGGTKPLMHKLYARQQTADERRRTMCVGEQAHIACFVMKGIRMRMCHDEIRHPYCFVMHPFLPRDALLSAVYAVVVCLCVCLSHSGIVSKRLNVAP